MPSFQLRKKPFLCLWFIRLNGILDFEGVCEKDEPDVNETGLRSSGLSPTWVRMPEYATYEELI